MQTQGESSLPMTTGLIERYRDEAQCLLWHANVQLILSRTTPSLQFMRRIISELDLLAATQRTRTGALLIIQDGVRPPDTNARHYIVGELRRSSMAAAAQVVLGSGFLCSGMRATLTAIQMACLAPYPMKVFADPGAGALWLSQQLRRTVGSAPTGAELVPLARLACSQFLASDLGR